MFVKIDNIWLNTDHIVAMAPSGKSFRIDLSNKEFLVLNLKDYLVLIKAMKIKSPLKAVKKKLFQKLPSVIPSPAVSDNAKPKRVAGKGTEANKSSSKHIGASGGKPKTKLVKKVDKKTK